MAATDDDDIVLFCAGHKLCFFASASIR
jgi:hypothetical protein